MLLVVVIFFCFFFSMMALAMSAIVPEKLNLFTFLIKMLIRDITEYAMKLSVRFMVEFFFFLVDWRYA